MSRLDTKRTTGWVLMLALTGGGLLAAGVQDPAHVKQLNETKQCQGCNFQDAELIAVNVRSGNVSNSDFRGANLYKADFQLADLTGAQFGGANLKGANLTFAKGASLAGAITNEETRCPSGAFGPCS